MSATKCSSPDCANEPDTAALYWSQTGGATELFLCKHHHSLLGVEYETPDPAQAATLGKGFVCIECAFHALIYTTNMEYISVVLKARDSRRVVLYTTGWVELNMLTHLAKKTSCARPPTHVFVHNAINALGGIPSKAIIEAYEPKEQAFDCVLHIQAGDQSTKVPCRVSDAVCLSILSGFPIMVHEAFLGEERVIREMGGR